MERLNPGALLASLVGRSGSGGPRTLEEKQEEVVGFPPVAPPCVGSGGLV